MLTRGDLDLENRTLVVRQGKGKKDRTIPLEDQAIAALLPEGEGVFAG